MTRAFLLATLGLMPALSCLAQEAGQLVPEPAIAEFVEAFPRVAGDTAAAMAINARLAELDDGLRDATDCDITREVTLGLDSAAYLSFFAGEGGYCKGAAHPYYIDFGLTFDRATGLPVDWLTLLPETLLETGAEEFDPNYPFASKALNKAYLAGLDPELANGECREVYDMGLAFDFWLRAGTGEGTGLALVPSSLPHAALACAAIVYLPVDRLRDYGVDARLLAALESGRADPAGE